jgi:hypothetical protein
MRVRTVLVVPREKCGEKAYSLEKTRDKRPTYKRQQKRRRHLPHLESGFTPRCANLEQQPGRALFATFIRTWLKKSLSPSMALKSSSQLLHASPALTLHQ